MSPAQCDKIRENKKALEAALPGPFGIPDQTLTGGLTLRSQLSHFMPCSTPSFIRKVWLPKTLAYILREWKKSQDELKGFLGDEYQDFDLVVALPNGRPCEDRIILKEFAKLREDAGLPKVVFHSLRHSSTTYKLKLNHGDLKATQGDTGHAEIDMITSIYAHILDEDRKVNAQKFETAFYAKPDLRNVRPPEEPAKSEPATLDLESLVEQLQKSPELASALAALIAAQAPAK